MTQQHKASRGASIGDFITTDQLEIIKSHALGPLTIEEKLEYFRKLTVEYTVTNPKTNYKTRRSRLGQFINKIYNTELVLPSAGRWQQIQKAIKAAKEYLIDNPEVSVYYAAAAGAAIEYREWQAEVGGMTEEQQMSAVTSEASVQQ